MIIRGGENIYPKEIEDVLAGDPSVLEAAVIGVPDEKWGEIVVAYVQPRTRRDRRSRALQALCARNLSRLQAPDRDPSWWSHRQERGRQDRQGCIAGRPRSALCNVVTNESV